jgi:glycerol-3-phosphate O-acyltransferase
LRVKPEILGPIRQVFGSKSADLRDNSVHKRTITPDNVFQEANTQNRGVIDQILDKLVLPGSELLHAENLAKLGELAKAGKSCLILMEHYSNFDIPCLYYLAEKAGLHEAAEAIVSIAGMKLSEESEFVNAFAEAYTRIVIYPSRSLNQHSDSERMEEERARSREINMAATRQMIRMKHEGRIILVFPSGTRYREGDPDTKRGVKEVDSYLKLFDYAVLIGIAGSTLRIDPAGDMSMDQAARDVMLLNVTEPFVCDTLRDEARATAPEDLDPKQHVANVVMERLERVHEDAERERAARL